MSLPVVMNGTSAGSGCFRDGNQFFLFFFFFLNEVEPYETAVFEGQECVNISSFKGFMIRVKAFTPRHRF